MIDLEKDIHLTPQDLLDQERVGKQRQGGVTLDSYMEFLDALQALFPRLTQQRSREADGPLPERPFELLGGDRR